MSRERDFRKKLREVLIKLTIARGIPSKTLDKLQEEAQYIGDRLPTKTVDAIASNVKHYLEMEEPDTPFVKPIK